MLEKFDQTQAATPATPVVVVDDSSGSATVVVDTEGFVRTALEVVVVEVLVVDVEAAVVCPVLEEVVVVEFGRSVVDGTDVELA